MFNRLKQKINELHWSLNNLQPGTIQRELYKEFFEALDTIDKEDDEMMQTTLKENTMQVESKEYQIYIACDDKRLYDDLHEAVNNVLKNHKGIVTLMRESEVNEH